jgi:hypothetical protein
MANNGERTLTITADDHYDIYVNGKKQTVPNSGQWSKVDIVSIEKSDNIIAIRASDGGEPHLGIIASSKDGTILTNEDWKVTNDPIDTTPAVWTKRNFDDSSWPKANAVSQKKNIQHVNFSGRIHPDAKWIWTDNEKDRTVYARLKLPVVFFEGTAGTGNTGDAGTIRFDPTTNKDNMYDSTTGKITIKNDARFRITFGVQSTMNSKTTARLYIEKSEILSVSSVNGVKSNGSQTCQLGSADWLLVKKEAGQLNAAGTYLKIEEL